MMAWDDVLEEADDILSVPAVKAHYEQVEQHLLEAARFIAK